MPKLIGTLIELVVELLFLGIWSILIGFPMMFLWDWLMPAIFGVGQITLLQAMGLAVFCGLLFRK